MQTHFVSKPSPSRMVLLESPPALFTSPPTTEVFPYPCVTTCSLIFTNANIMSEPVKNIPFFPFICQYTREFFLPLFPNIFAYIPLGFFFVNANNIKLFCLFLFWLLNIFVCEMKYRLRPCIFKFDSSDCNNKVWKVKYEGRIIKSGRRNNS